MSAPAIPRGVVADLLDIADELAWSGNTHAEAEIRDVVGRLAASREVRS